MISKRDIAKLEGLMYLYALSKSGSKREVAEKLGASVDTINKYISDLEAELSTIFLVTSGRGTALTPEGERVLEVSKRIVQAVRSVDEYAESAVSYKGIVRLWMSDAIADYLGAGNLIEFSEQYPDIHIENTISNRFPNMGKLETDIFLGYEAPKKKDQLLVGINNVKCGIYASQSYIDKFGMPKDKEDMLLNHRICDKSNHVLYVSGWRDMMERAQHIVYMTNSIFSLRDVLEAGMGMGICPVRYGDKKLVRIDSVDFEFYLQIFMIAHRDTKDMPRIRVVIDYVKNLFNQI